jgi:hypothetical protein
MTPCPFYGVRFVMIPKSEETTRQLITLPSGNGCALILGDTSQTCRMVREGHGPNWFVCPRNPEVNEVPQ